MSLREKLKKILVGSLITGLIIGSLGTPAIAAPSANARANGASNAKIKIDIKGLKDIRGHWAEEILTEMNLKGLIKGYDDQSFKPSNVVKRVEAVVMLIRALDLEGEVENVKIKLDAKQLKNIPDWAQGYIQVAVNEGLLTEKELEKFNPNQALTRAELSTYIVRALKLDRRTGTNFELKFLDTKDIPKDLMTYVGLLVQNGIMKGVPGNLFQPNKPIERAEMAVLLERLKGNFVDQDLSQVDGTLRSIDLKNETISITTIKDGVKRFELDDDAIVYLDENKVSLADLKAGDQVRLTIDENEVVLIRAQRTEAAEATYVGSIVRLVFGSDGSITIREKDKDFTFQVDASTRIIIDGKRGFLMDLRTWQEATIIARGDNAIRIDVGESPAKEIYEGVLSGLTLGSNPGLRIRDIDGERHNFKVNDQTKIFLQGETVGLDKLELGFEVKVVATDGLAISIEAKTPLAVNSYEGIVKGLALGINPGVTLLSANNKYYTFSVNEETKVYLNSKRIELETVKLDYKIKVSAQKKLALQIETWDK